MQGSVACATRSSMDVPQGALAVVLWKAPPVTKLFVYELGWDRADARAVFRLAGLVTLGSQFPSPFLVSAAGLSSSPVPALSLRTVDGCWCCAP